MENLKTGDIAARSAAVLEAKPRRRIGKPQEMQIAQVSPLDESCPPQFYGGTERVVSYLTEELVRRGHEVTLFASGDSRTEAALRAIGPRALRLDSECKDRLPHHLLMLHRVLCCVDDFDIVHFHTHYLHFPLFAGRWGRRSRPCTDGSTGQISPH